MLETFHKFMGTGLIVIWYLAAVIFLFLKEKRRPVRVMFLYVPVVILVIFFNPVFAKLFEKFLGMEIYFRMLWMLPMTPTLGYSIVLGCELLPKRKAAGFLAVCAVLVVTTGTIVYRNPLFSRAENIHHVPQEVVEICDKIQVEGREVMALFPIEHLLYVRQYSSVVCMPYGRNAMIYPDSEELFRVMLKGTIDVERMAVLAKEKGCHYVIFSEKEKELNGRLEDYDYEYFDRVGEYLIYRDTTMDFSLIWRNAAGEPVYAE